MRVISLFPFLLFTIAAWGQELNCRVIVNADQIQTTDRNIFPDMEKRFSEFMNNTIWTDDTFSEEEKIKCNLLITISEMPSIGFFKASVQVLSNRPVYGTSYESLVLNFGDRDWEYDYLQNQPMQFNENTFLSNITSLLAYYAYIIIGMDYDTFSELGGNTYFDKAFQIVSNAEQSNYPGWSQFNSIRNRYWLIENLRSPQLEGVRKANYLYHRQGLDMMGDQKEEAERNVIKSLSEVNKANRTRPRSILTISFVDAKSSEIVQMFADSPIASRRQVYSLLNSIDPSRSDQFRKLIE